MVIMKFRLSQQIVAVILALFSVSAFVCADDSTAIEQGKLIYAEHCVRCHGKNGQGTSDYSESLYGDLAISDLAKSIALTMPESDPNAVVGAEANQVAEYIYDQFYSRAAQRRLHPVRVELARLTVRQYKESVADLGNAFGRPFDFPNERGLYGSYFASRNWTKKRQLSQQTDPTLDFAGGVPHFDSTGEYKQFEPDEKKANKMNDGFAVFWSGSLVPPRTGTYQITVESLNGFRLHLNDKRVPLIDQFVRSDDVVAHSAKIFLLGGRPYPLQLRMFSYPDPPAKIRLLWTPPNGPQSVIPARALLPKEAKKSLAVSTRFPADDASAGFERGVLVSRQWDDATSGAAIEMANWVAADIWRLAGTKDNAADRLEKVKVFSRKFVERAFVKQLSDDEFQFFVGQHFENDLPLADQVKRVVILALKSPRFLYPGVEWRDASFETARRMALVIWDSLPDQRLNKLARSGKLTDPAIVQAEFERMIADPRAKSKLHAFFNYWLKTDRAAEATKDHGLYPDFDEQLLSDLQQSLELYLDEVVWSGDSDFRQLFLADYLYVNRRLSGFYGLEVNAGGVESGKAESVGDETGEANAEASDAGESELDDDEAGKTEPDEDVHGDEDGFDGSADFRKIVVDAEQRAGILTHPYLMSGLAYHKNSSPIHRGVFVARNLLGRRLKQPPDNVKPLTEEFKPEMTTRERVAHQTKEVACMNCHSVINPLGFSLEHYDAVGRFRMEEKQKPIDVATIYKTPDGETVSLGGARDLANFLANNEMAQKSFVRQLFQHYAKQPIGAYGEDQLDELHVKFVENDFSIQRLIVEIGIVTTGHISPTESKASDE